MRSDSQDLTIVYIPVDRLEPNPWNPNEMDEATFRAEVASIQEFGFIDPLVVREVIHHDDPLVQRGQCYQIIDGFHRWMGAKELGYTELPSLIIEASDDEAKELTIILNETRGRAEPKKLEALVKDLAERRDRSRLDNLLPFDRSHLDQMLDRRGDIDWSGLEERRNSMEQGGKEDDVTWVEKTYRMPADAALVIDEAIEKVKEMEEVPQDWRGLEMICADFLGT